MKNSSKKKQKDERFCHLCGSKEIKGGWCTNKSCYEYIKHEKPTKKIVQNKTKQKKPFICFHPKPCLNCKKENRCPICKGWVDIYGRCKCCNKDAF